MSAGSTTPVVVLRDTDGNLVGVVLDGAIWRVQTESKLVAGTATVGRVQLRNPGDTVNLGDITNPVRVDVTGTTAQPVTDNGGSLTVDAVSWPLPTGAATETTLGGVLTTTAFQARVNTLGQKTAANSTPMVLASDQTVIPVNDNGGSLTVDGTVTANQGTAAALSGRWPVTHTDGTNSMPTGDVAGRGIYHRITDGTNTATVKAASTAAVASDVALVVAVSPNNTIPISMAASGYGGQVEGRAAAAAAVVGNPVLMGGTDGTLARSLLVDTSGRLVTAPAGSSATATAGFAAGYVNTAATTRVAVRATAYTEQAANATRSVSSANAADTSAGTGARTVQITYYTATFTGPFTTNITMNGTSAVNTSVSDICYIESVKVLTVGSGGTNAGIITLFAAAAGGGGAIGTVAAGDGQTFWAHHYVATGATAYVTGMSVNHNGTVVGSGGVFTLRRLTQGVANAVEAQISDFIRLYGQSSTFARTFGTALVVAGPARIVAYVAPEASSALQYRCAIDYYDEA